MKNEAPRSRDRFDIFDGRQDTTGLFWLPVLGYVVGLFEPDRLVGAALAVWAFSYAFMTPFLARRVAVRSPPGDPWRAAATLAYGALPFALYVPLWRELTTRAALLIAFPVLYVWGAVAIWMALRDTPPPQTPRMRSVMLAGAGLIYAAVSLTLLGAAGFGILMRLWAPIEGTMAFSLLFVAVGLPLSALAGWASLKLFTAASAAQSSRDVDAPTIS